MLACFLAQSLFSSERYFAHARAIEPLLTQSSENNAIDEGKPAIRRMNKVDKRNTKARDNKRQGANGQHNNQCYLPQPADRHLTAPLFIQD
jgi:hypothetical protein